MFSLRRKIYCPVERTLAIVGDRWSMLILRDLRNGARKFRELQASLKGISPNTLSARLKLLEEHGILGREFYEQHPPRAQYRLTPKGDELRSVLGALRNWGEKHTAP
jgi:DNA-binding HxlR family transcriptional regulator